MQITPLAGAGAEITGVDLRRLTNAEFASVKAAYAQYGVLFFRDQSLSEDDHIAFARRFGSGLGFLLGWRISGSMAADASGILPRSAAGCKALLDRPHWPRYALSRYTGHADVGMEAERWGVYLLRCADQTLYCGVTNDVKNRLELHNAGRGARYTRGRRPVKLLAWSGLVFTRGDALRAERQVKRCARGRKVRMLQALGRVGSGEDRP